MKKLFFFCVFVLALCLVLASCENGEKTEQSTAPPITTATATTAAVVQKYELIFEWPILHLYTETKHFVLERVESAESDKMVFTRSDRLCMFIQDTHIEGIVWELYATEEYPDLEYVLMDGMSGRWVLHRLRAEELPKSSEEAPLFWEYADCLASEQSALLSFDQLKDITLDMPFDEVYDMAGNAQRRSFEQLYDGENLTQSERAYLGYYIYDTQENITVKILFYWDSQEKEFRVFGVTYTYPDGHKEVLKRSNTQ